MSKSLPLAIALGLAPVATAAQTPNPPVVASADSRWEHVYCDVTQLSRASPSELMIRFQYRNARKATFSLPHTELVPSTRVLDAAARVLYGVLKDAAGKPIASVMRDGSLSRPIPAGAAQAHWARVEAPPEGVRSVTVLIEGCLPLENVTIGAVRSLTPLASPAAALASQEADAPGLAVEVTGLTRGAGGFLTVTVRYRNTGSAALRLPNAASAGSSRIVSLYALDTANRQKYTVARDKAQRALSSESIELGGGSLGESLDEGAAVSFWALLPAPAEATKTLTLVVPQAPPFDEVPISGTGSGPAGAGSAVAGAVVGLDAALKDLGAQVSEAEIRIELAADVLFDFDKADIKKEAEPSLQKLATVLRAHPTAKVGIEGHSDGRGADAYNQRLSEQRAASVKQWLVTEANIDGAGIATRGWGKAKPVAPNAKPDGSDDPAGRAKNRRVEVVVRRGG